MERINHLITIITTIVIPFLRLITEPRAVYTNSTSKLDMVLMIDKDMIWFNKQGNCNIILETWIYYNEEHSLICLEDL
jgi:hypothetical protein